MYECRIHSKEDEMLIFFDSGFGTIMADSAMIIMWPNSDGSVTMSQRNATGLVEPLVDPLPPRVATKFAPLISVSIVTALVIQNIDLYADFFDPCDTVFYDQQNRCYDSEPHLGARSLEPQLVRSRGLSSSASRLRSV